VEGEEEGGCDGMSAGMWKDQDRCTCTPAPATPAAPPHRLIITQDTYHTQFASRHRDTYRTL
jgi:hypothetical protein